MTGLVPLSTRAWMSFDKVNGAGSSAARREIWAMARMIGQSNPRPILVVLVLTFMILGVSSIGLMEERRKLTVAALLGPFIEANRKDNDESDDGSLPKRGYPEQNQTVSQHPDNQHAENGTKDRSLPPGKRGAPDDGGGNDVQFQAN